MYGYYLKNWCPTEKGWGLTLSEVQIYMGHSDINSTKRYARDDALKLRATINYANALADTNKTFSINTARIDMLKKELQKLEDLVSTNEKSIKHL